MTDATRRDFDLLERAGLVLLALQIAIFAALWMATGFDRASTGYPVFLMSTGLLVAGQRKLTAMPVTGGAAPWILAMRAVVLTMLTIATLAVAFYRLVPAAAPAPEFVPRVLLAFIWIIIALKGAAMGKLRPGSGMGLRVPWTRQSRLAWDRGHRALGRILFWGGLAGLAMSLVVAPLTSFTLWATTVALAVTTALIESWRAWRLDPARSRPA
jgi:uncharacterized membrane protein